MLGAKSAAIVAMHQHIADERQDQANELHALKQRLFEAQKKATFREAAKDALAEMAYEINSEVKGLKPRRLSDPANRDLRNDWYVDRMQEKVSKTIASNPRAADGTKIEITEDLAKDFKSRKQLR